jgi:small-conductance mechanosensitive channel
VHELLCAAAVETGDILAEPPPFVHQKSLNDYSVAYELNAYTQSTSRMAAIYSDLHQHIQDRFNQAGIEIMSPAYSAVRDGNQMAIPEEYLPNSYQAPSFRLSPLEKLLGLKQREKPSDPDGS